jgi:hypothetical protein
MLNAELKTVEPVVESDFTEARWIELVDRVSLLFHVDTDRKEKILQNKAMKLTAAIPFIAGCRNPMRTALSHLTIYVAAASEGGKDVFGHNFSDNDDIFTRLERISHFDGGDEKLIDRGMNLLALAMLEDHKADADDDRLKGKYNPVNTGAWRYEETVGKLKDRINAVPCRSMDNIYGPDQAPGYWDS